MTKLLAALVESYELAKEITPEYAYQLGYAVRRLNRYLGRDATTEDLNEQTINKWLKHERDVGEINDRSRANVRTSVLTIWSRYGDGLNREKIRTVVQTPRNPEAWEYAELCKVATAAQRLEGNLTNGLARCDYMRTVLWFVYETGLRRRDVWSFDIQQFSDRKAALTQHKTRRVHVVAITPQTERDLQSLSRWLRERGDQNWRTPMRWPQSTSTFYDLMSRCRTLAGVDPQVRNRSLQHVRRTGATAIDLEGGAPWKFLGHSREGLDRKSYVDQRKVVRPTIPSLNRSQENGCNIN